MGLDEAGRVNDFCFPYVGFENHIDAGNPHRVGVYLNGSFSWLDAREWKIESSYQKETMAGLTQALNSHLGVRLEMEDAVYNEKNIFVRKVKVFNNRNEDRQIKLYFNQEFQLYGTHWGNTAYYHPETSSIIHYKSRRVFLVSGRMPTSGMEGQKRIAAFGQYTTGMSRYHNMAGTWKDAEDGELSRNPIEHGSVDSTIGFTLDIKARSYRTVYYWICAAKDIEAAHDLNNYIVKKGPQHLLRTTTDYWRAWTGKQKFSFHNLSEDLIDSFKTSLLVIRSQTDKRGGILASSDPDILQYGKDTYNYVWPRDAAYVAMALDKGGYFDITQKFFQFAHNSLRKEGYLMHKYHTDNSLGSSWHPWILNGEPIMPIQEDETAIVLYALWRHYKVRRDLDLIEEFFNPFIKKMADFLCTFRSHKFNLPQPSYDLWEERFGISTYTVASVYGALQAAAFFSDLLGKKDLANKYLNTAEEFKQGMMEELYLKDEKRFAKMLEFKNGEFHLNTTPDISSAMGVSEFDVLDDKEFLDAVVENTVKELRVNTDIGGLARYVGDNYYQVDPSLPGNPWFLTTLWHARHLVSRAKNENDMGPVKDYLRWAHQNGISSGLFTEQVHPHTGEPLSVSPLTWSHAFYVLTVIEYLEKLSELGVCELCEPITLRFK